MASTGVSQIAEHIAIGLALAVVGMALVIAGHMGWISNLFTRRKHS